MIFLAVGVGFPARGGCQPKADAPLEYAFGAEFNGGGGEIRTHDTLADIPLFESGAFNHSATPPCLPKIS